MTQILFFHTMEVLVFAALAILFFAHPWQTFCTDVSRQKLFELRDRLFSLAMEGKISFDDPVYQSTRNWLNRCIRYAERNAFGDLAAFLIARKGSDRRLQSVEDKFASVENQELRAELQKIHLHAAQINLVDMLIRSPVLLVFSVLAPVFILIGAVHGGVRAFVRWLTRIADAASCDAHIQSAAE